MTPPIPKFVPQTFRAGETVKFHRGFNDYPPSDGWVYTIYFNGPTQKFSSEAVDDGEGFLVTLTPTDTAVAPGIYRYLERVSKAATNEVYRIGQGVVEVEPDLATADPGADQSFAEKMLDAIEAELLVRVTADVEEYSVQASSLGGGRSMKKIPMETLKKMRGQYASMVWRQKNPGKIGAPVRIQFTDETNSQEFPDTWVDVTGLPGAGQ